MKKRIVSLFLVGITIFCTTNAQEIPNRIQKKYKEALQYVSNKKFDAAINALKECTQEAPTFAEAHQMLADILRKNKRYAEAKQSYQKVLNLNPKLSPLTYYGIAETQMATGEYEQAKYHFTIFIGNNPQNKNLEKAKKMILDCEFAIKALASPVPFSPQNMGANINTKNQEYLPTLTADENKMIFTRRASNNEDFYRSTKDDKHKWSFAVPLKGAINTPLNEGSQSITPDGRYLFFAGCNRGDGLGRCDIYMSTHNGEEWTAAQNLGAPINSAAWESQPSITADGNTLYFVSNRAGGYGGYDIWKSTLQEDGSWSDPENLGPNINTKYDEMSPFIHPDGVTLYFSSNGWPGMGNKDIFISRLSIDETWTIPKNLGYPINTFEEESSFIVSADGKKAYFAADRTGGFGALDIYEITLEDPATKPNPVSYVWGKVIDKDSKEIVLADAQVIDLKSNKIVFNNLTDPSDGSFLAVMPTGGNYALYISKGGYLFYSANFALDKNNDTELKPFEIQVGLEKIKNNAETVLANIFFDTNKFNLLPLSLLELEKLNSFLQQNPNIQIQIEGHTDNIGNDELNQTLSLNRAKAVYEYLIKKGISKNRLNFEGFGKNKPIAPNDSEEGRQKNRRTTFRIIKI